MKHPLAFVLSGGGALGALQVGALRALFEAKVKPDILVGTSVGAINSAFLALHGWSLSTLEALNETWHLAAHADLLPSNYMWLTIRAVFDRSDENVTHRWQAFLTSHVVPPLVQFKEIHWVRLYLVATDLNGYKPVIYGTDPEQSVSEGILASSALPPWVKPINKDGYYLVDGGLVSHLPVEPALSMGAAEIVALHLDNPYSIPVEARGFRPFLNKSIQAMQDRQMRLELALAEARRVPVHHVQLSCVDDTPLWDFTHTDTLIERGYDLMQTEIEGWQASRRSWWLDWFPTIKKEKSA